MSVGHANIYLSEHLYFVHRGAVPFTLRLQEHDRRGQCLGWQMSVVYMGYWIRSWEKPGTRETRKRKRHGLTRHAVCGHTLDEILPVEE